MSHSSLEFLRHMLDECDYLVLAAERSNSESFIRDATLKRAFVRSIEIIGEASKKVPPDMKARYADVEWRAIGGMRDRLIHDYFGVDYDIVWDVVRNKVPVLRAQLADMLNRENPQ